MSLIPNNRTLSSFLPINNVICAIVNGKEDFFGRQRISTPKNPHTSP